MTRTKPRHAWTNGFVERLQKTIMHEHWRIAFRRQYFTSRRGLQASLDRRDRDLVIVYRNPLHKALFENTRAVTKQAEFVFMGSDFTVFSHAGPQAAAPGGGPGAD